MDAYKSHTIGQQFELEAYQFLHERGLRLLARNYHCYFGEIDLIMRDQQDLVFIEVRSRHHTQYGSAIESVTQHKTRKIIKTAGHFLMKKNWTDKMNCRFDVIAISPKNGQMTIEWIKNAFQ
ncbi:MAG: YraN family protein [Gammaproteobacteria bacterium RIFCSPHIGHO2_12_FULL_45_12]|nr:MAG: YraN family protein [Gammaproteobacteria bacterium RIFCSPHIGHO2_12_FULL_45_12]